MLLMYYRKGWNRPPDFKVALDEIEKPVFISVIVPARNEEHNIGILINSLLAQDYPVSHFELIVVDDHSTDDTARIVKNYHNERIRLVQLTDAVSKSGAFKKLALESGIAIAKGELIVTTDADCVLPASWLSAIASFYCRYHPKMIVMPVLIRNNASLLGVFQTLDFLSLQGITGAAIQQDFHGMCNGANLAYEKKVFEEVGGFRDIDHIASGDDMLLLQKIKRTYNNGIFYLKSKNVIVETAAENSLSSFIHQRLRWGGKADKYIDKSLLPVLLLVYLLNLFLLLGGVWSCFHFNEPACEMSCPSAGFIYITMVSLKTIAELFFLMPVSKFFGTGKLLWIFPLLQPFHIVYTVLIGALSKMLPYTWKGRKSK